MSTIPTERAQLQALLQSFAPRDIFNADETGLFMYQQPSRGLADCAMSGKKHNKARITVLLVTNADGSEKLEPLFIGKSKQPRCFKGTDGKKRTARQLGFEYHNNKKAWMTREVFTP
jgi:hypothetical protein